MNPMTSDIAMKDVAVAPTSATDGEDAPKKKRKWNVSFWLASAWLILMAIVVLYPPLAAWINNRSWLPSVPETWFFLDDPTERVRDRELLQQPPTWGNLMGRDDQGRDILSRVVDGAKISLWVALVGTTVGIVLGGALGLLAGYLRGWVDSLVRLIINVTLSIPALLLVIFIVAIRDASLTSVIFALCLLAVPAIARIVRASALQVADREFVKAAEVIGTKRLTILLREILPNVMPTLVSFAFLTTGIILVAESSLSFLGLSVQAPTITWGSVIASGRRFFNDAPHMVFMPALALFMTVLATNLVGDHMLKRYDIRESSL